MTISTRSKQYHSDGPNQGFVTIQTEQALNPRWQMEIGPVAYASPVIGADGTIYIGNLKGELVAVNPDGSLKWKRILSANTAESKSVVITGSPAIGSDGNIYAISTLDRTVRDHRNGSTQVRKERRSSLYSLDPSGNLRFRYDFPQNTFPQGIGAYTSSSPKLWGGPENLLIFVPAIYRTAGMAVELLVINQNGNLIYKADVSSYPPIPLVGEGPGLGEILDAIWDFISSPVDFDTSGVGTSLEEQFGWPEPTLAIVDYPQFGTQPFIIVDDNYKNLSAFKWQFPILVPIWTNKSSSGRLHSSPAVFANGVLAVGGKNGTLEFYEAKTGKEIWKPWYKAGKPIIAPPSSFGRQVYFVAGKKLIVLDSNSSLWKERSLQGSCLSAPVLSANFAYVAANDGLYTFSFDLQDMRKNTDVIGGVSSPVIGDDGSIYVMDLKNTLWAFGGQTQTTPGNKKRDHRRK